MSNSKMAERHLDVLEERVQTLENLVFGPADKDAMYPKDDLPKLQCIDSLSNVQTKLSKTVTGRKKVAEAYDKITQLEKYLDPAYSDKLTLPDSAKTDIILSEEAFIRQRAKDLEEIETLFKFMSSDHIKVVPTLSGKLQQLSQIQIKQQDQTSEFTEEARNLVSAYNSIITLLTKQFAQWDETLTKLEIAAQPKKPSS